MEKFSFDFFKMKFDSTNPGKETKSNLIILLIFFVVLVVLVLILMHVFGISLGTIGWSFACGKSITYISSVIKKCKGGRSP